VGAEMLARIDGLEEIVPWVRHSHEHIDGSGYPDGLAGEAIPVASRILLVADAFDAMTSDRPYRRALPVQQALAELRRHAGTQFDAVCVETLALARGEAEPVEPDVRLAAAAQGSVA
jgi:polar amino acid transport system substrate-binding protein